MESSDLRLVCRLGGSAPVYALSVEKDVNFTHVDWSRNVRHSCCLSIEPVTHCLPGKCDDGVRVPVSLFR